MDDEITNKELSEKIYRRIKILANIEKESFNSFFKKNKMCKNTFGSFKRKNIPSGYTLYKLVNNSNININWLLTGKGDIYLDKKDLRNNDTLFLKISKNEIIDMITKVTDKSKIDYINFEIPMRSYLKNKI